MMQHDTINRIVWLFGWRRIEKDEDDDADDDENDNDDDYDDDVANIFTWRPPPDQKRHFRDL